MLVVMLAGFTAVWKVERFKPDAVFSETGALATRYSALPVFLGASVALLLKMIIIAFAGAMIRNRFPGISNITRWLMAAIFLWLAYEVTFLREAVPVHSAEARDTESETDETLGIAARRRPFVHIVGIAFAAMFFSEWFDYGQMNLIFEINHKNYAGVDALWAGVGGGLALITKETLGAVCGVPVRRLVGYPIVRWGIAACCVIFAVHTLTEKNDIPPHAPASTASQGKR